MNDKKLIDLLETFKADSKWNTENKDGTHRFDEDLIWIEGMIRSYADFFKMSVDDTTDLMESKRDYNWPNYYQPGNFPALDDPNNKLVIFDTVEDFKKAYKGFKCPICQNIYTHPTDCEHILLKDGICDWVAYGLFKGPYRVIIKEHSLTPIHIFKPVPF